MSAAKCHRLPPALLYGTMWQKPGNGLGSQGASCASRPTSRDVVSVGVPTLPELEARRLTVLHLKQVGLHWVADIQRFKPKDPAHDVAPLAIVWGRRVDERDVRSYWNIGSKQIYVRKSPAYAEPIVMNDAGLSHMGKDRYGFTDFADLIVTVFPEGHTALEVDPAATAVADKGCLELIWRPVGNRVSWVVAELKRELSFEVERINRQETAKELPENVALMFQGDMVLGNKNVANNAEIAVFGDGAEITQQPKTDQSSHSSSLWVSGTFYVFLIAVAVALVLAIYRVVSPLVFPAAVAGVLILFVSVGLFVLRQQQRIEQKHFVALMTKILGLVPPFDRWLAKPNPTGKDGS